MSITYVGAASANPTATGSVMIPAVTGVQAGDYLLAGIASTGSPAVPTGWSSVIATGSVLVIGRTADTTATDTPTVTASGAVMVVTVRAYRGVSGLDGTGYRAGTNSTTVAVPSLTTTVAADVIALFYDAASTSGTNLGWTAPSGFSNATNAATTPTASTYVTLGSSDETVAAAGTAIAGTITLASAHTLTAYAVALKSAGPTAGTLSVNSSGGNDTLTYTAPTAGANAVAGTKLYRGTTPGGENATAIATNTGTGSGTFTSPTATTSRYYYFVEAYDTAATPLYSAPSNEVSAGVTLPTIGAISLAPSGSNEIITYPAPAAGTNPVGGVALFRGTASGAESGTPLLTNAGTGAGTFTTPAPTTGSYFYFVEAYDTAATPNYSLPSNEVSVSVQTSIAPNDANLLYSPENWYVTSSSATAINPGAKFRGLFAAPGVTSVSLSINVANLIAPLPQLKYRVNSGPWQYATVAATVPLTIPSGTSWPNLAIEVVLKSTTQTVNRFNTPTASGLVFTGITFGGSSGVTSLPVTPRSKTVLVYPDSRGEGVRTLTSANSNDTDNNDSQLAWPLQLEDALGAEVGVIGFGSQGIMHSPPSFENVPNLQNSYNLIYQGQPRTFASNPDVIVIAEAINDAGNGVSVAAYQAGLTAVLNGLLAATPTKTKLAVPSDLGTTSIPVPYALSVYKAAIAACTNPLRVYFIDTTSWFNPADSSDGTHPYGYTDVNQIAPLMAAALRAGPLAAGGTYLNIGGVATRVSPVRA